MSMGSGAALGGITAAIGLGVGLYGASKAGDLAPLRNMGSELDQIPYQKALGNAQSYVNAQLGNGQTYSNQVIDAYPGYSAAAIGGQNAEAQAVLGNYQQFAGQERAATSAQRAGDLSDVNKYGAGLNAAYAANSPGFAAVEGQLGQINNAGTPLLQQQNAQALGAGFSPLTQQLQAQASQQLALGGTLSAQQQRDAIQTADQGWSARGLGDSAGAVSAEVLGRDNYAQQLLGQRENLASSVAGLGDQELNANRQFGLGVQGANQALQGQNQQFSLNAANVTSQPLNQMLGNRAVNPTQAIEGAFSEAPSVGLASQVMSQAPSIFQGAQALAPLYNYEADVANTNFNAQQAAIINQANAYTSLGGGLISMGGQMMGGGGGGSSPGGGGASSMMSMM